MKRLAFAEPNKALDGPLPGAVLFDCSNEVAAARRFETAVTSQERSQENLIEPDAQDQEL